MSPTNARRVALVPGDGIGLEVVAEGERLLEATGCPLELVPLEAGWETFQRLGVALPPATLDALRQCDGALLGAVGSPVHRVPGYSSPLLGIRTELDLYANLRPLTSAPVPGSQPDVDILIVRENTEGLYSRRERLEEGGEVAIAERVISRKASRRIAQKAFEEARRRGGRGPDGRPLVTVVHKANVLRQSDGLFRETVLEVAQGYADVEVEEQLVDSMVYRLIREPQAFDVVVAPNLYGDVLSDAGAALVGGLGLAPSANVGAGFVLAEPVHGSAPDIAGQGSANPIATLRAVALLLQHLGFDDVAGAVQRAINATLSQGPHTPDLGGSAGTRDVTDAVMQHLDAELQRGSPRANP